jgi:hypothetical protein
MGHRHDEQPTIRIHAGDDASLADIEGLVPAAGVEPPKVRR